MVDELKSKRPGVLGTIIGVLATLALGGPALYFTIQERTPSLKYEISSEANVFDLHKSLESLDIIFQGKNIRKAKQNLRIITLTLRNDGRVTILQDHFDMTEEWGIKVENAELVDTPRIVDSNSEYLSDKLQPAVINGDTVVFQKVIFERGKYISLELLLLHSADTPPTLRPMGKIANIDQLVVSKRPAEHVVSTFWGSVIQGSFWMHISRVGMYVVILIVTILVLTMLGKISSARTWRRNQLVQTDRKKRFEKHFQELFNEMTPAEKDLATALLQATGGRTEALQELRDIVTSEETVQIIGGGEKFCASLCKSEVGNMFTIESHIPESIFEKQGENDYIVSERAARVLPALADFVSLHPVPDNIVWERREYMDKKKEEGLDWSTIYYETTYAQQRH